MAIRAHLMCYFLPASLNAGTTTTALLLSTTTARTCPHPLVSSAHLSICLYKQAQAALITIRFPLSLLSGPAEPFLSLLITLDKSDASKTGCCLLYGQHKRCYASFQQCFYLGLLQRSMLMKPNTLHRMTELKTSVLGLLMKLRLIARTTL